MTVEPLTAQDEAALRQELALGRRVCEFYLDSAGSSDFETIDRVLDFWFGDARRAKPTGNDLARGLGSLIGDQLCTRFNCRWVVVTDTFGCDLGVVHDATGWQFFPRHWIAKRLDPSNAGTAIVSSIMDTLKAEGVFGGG